MSRGTEEVSAEVDELRRLLAARDAQLAEKEARIELLEQQNALLRKRIFGAQSEKAPATDDAQALLFNEAEAFRSPAEEEQAQQGAPAGEQRPHKRGRRPLAKNLLRNRIIHDLAEADRVCGCGTELTHIGDSVSEELDIIPQRVVVNEHVYRKYACKHCEGTADETQPAVRTARTPRLLAGSIAGPGLLAYILVGKFCDALPFYRQEKIFERLGARISRGTMCNWTIAVAEKLGALRAALLAGIKQGPVVGIDETTVQVLKEEGRPATSQSYMWTLRGGESEHPVIAYEYRPTRSGSVVAELLGGYSGAVISDAYSGYNVLDGMQKIKRAGCWAHARRNFINVREAAGTTPEVDWILAEIGKLYRIEKDLRGVGPPKRRKVRRQVALPILNELFHRFDLLREQTPPTSLLGKAVRYALDERDRLLVYVEDGNVPIDNNAVENSIRPFVVGRKNWLFSDTPDGADASAFIYSLIETAKANGHVPYRYLRFLFEVFCEADRSPENLRELLPHRVTPDHVERHFRSRGLE